MRRITLFSLYIGNGPSAMFLSLMLSGYCPFYSGSHPNQYLAEKLRENPKDSLVDQVRHASSLQTNLTALPALDIPILHAFLFLSLSPLGKPYYNDWDMKDITIHL